MSVSWVARSLGILYVFAVVIMLARLGRPDRIEHWAAMAPFLGWVASPILAGVFVASKLDSDPAKMIWTFLLSLIAFAGFGAQWHDLFVAPPDAQSALALLMGPLYQWGGLTIIALAWLLWRAIESKR